MERLKQLDVKTVRLALAGLIVVLAAIILAGALLGGGSDEGPSAEEAVALSESELLARSSSLSHPAYWLGPRPGTTSYELTSTADGRIYIRYLTGDAEAGDPRSSFVTVGTYSLADAHQALAVAAGEDGEGRKLTKHAGYELLAGKKAKHAYVVFDDQPQLQVEVYSPKPGEAASLATSASLRPLG